MRSNGLKGQQALSPGQRPGYKEVDKSALKGQKPYLVHYALFMNNSWSFVNIHVKENIKHYR